MGYDGGIGKLRRRWNRIPEAVKEAALRDTVAAAEDIANRMRALVPVDSSALKDSITVTPGGERTPAHSQPGGQVIVPENKVMITAGDDAARYGHLVEWGTEKAPAQPFFFPGYRLGKKKAKAKIKRGIRKAIKDTK